MGPLKGRVQSLQLASNFPCCAASEGAAVQSDTELRRKAAAREKDLALVPLLLTRTNALSSVFYFFG